MHVMRGQSDVARVLNKPPSSRGASPEVEPPSLPCRPNMRDVASDGLGQESEALRAHASASPHDGTQQVCQMTVWHADSAALLPNYE